MMVIAINLASNSGSVTSVKRDNPMIVFNINLLLGGWNDPK